VEIVRIPILKDNYTFLLIDRLRSQAAVVDPGESAPVQAFLNQQKLDLVAIFNTHHHRDHVGGNLALQRHFPAITIYGSAADGQMPVGDQRGRIPGQQVYLKDGDTVTFGRRQAQVLFIPGHTLGHIAYYWPPEGEQPGDLFCGDTIFGAGCGRLFEGTSAQMLRAIERLRQFPANTRLWYAHEYTWGNLRFALTIEPDNLALQQRYQKVQADRQQPTCPSTIGLEQQTNPFLRWDSPSVAAAMAADDPVQVFARLRGRKDKF
jgi:hydroxyacylglutathione hydrolase